MRIRFEHHMLGSEHVLTSPDVTGLYIVAPTRAQAEAEATLIVAQLQRRAARNEADVVLTAVEYQAA